MLKKSLLTIAVTMLIAGLFVALGGADENPMLGFGLSLTLAAGLVTIGLAIRSKLAAMRVQFEPTEVVEQKQSYGFTHTDRLMGVKLHEPETLRLLRDLSASVDEHKQKISNLEFDRDVMKSHLRICFDNIRYHEEITLPQALAASWGGTVMSAIGAMIGAVIAAFPVEAFQLAKAMNAILLSFFC